MYPPHAHSLHLPALPGVKQSDALSCLVRELLGSCFGMQSTKSWHFPVHFVFYPNGKLMEKTHITPTKPPYVGHLHKSRKAGTHGTMQAGCLLQVLHYFPSLLICQANVQEIIYFLTNSDNLKTAPRTFAMSWFQLPPLIP